ncbi:MAG: MMPL family transporter, partial [Bifidobacteriaceae bacterium]|nr:MMPL family transporter [Bifidobacteriaceae bacterium]
MFLRLGHGIVRHPVWTVAAWAVLTAAGLALAVFGVTGDGLFDRVNSGAPRAVESDSNKADQIIEEGAASAQSLTLAVNGLDLTDPARVGPVAAALAPVRQDLAEIDGVAERDDGYPMVLDPLNPSFCADPAINPASAEAAVCAAQNPAAAALVADSGRGFLMTVDIAKGLSAETEDKAADAVAARLRLAARDLEDLDLRVAVGGESLIVDEIVGAMKHDLELGEMIALPVALVVMVLVFAGFLAAAMPVAGAIASIATCMGAVFGFTYLTDLHTAVINVISLVGLGLSIDYGLLVVSRFREEARRLRRLSPVDDADRAGLRDLSRQAVVATVQTAGRTVFYSALTIAVCVAGLMAFKPSILRTFGLAGLLVVLLALASATTLTPACLVLLGRRLIRPSLLGRLPGWSKLQDRSADAAPDQGVFSRLAGLVQRRPWLVMAGVLAVLAVFAWPARNIELRNSTVELLPEKSEQRQFLEILEADYPNSLADGIEVVWLGDIHSAEAFAKDKLSGIDGATPRGGPDGQLATEMDGYVRIVLDVSEADPEGPATRAAVKQIRS